MNPLRGLNVRFDKLEGREYLVLWMKVEIQTEIDEGCRMNFFLLFGHRPILYLYVLRIFYIFIYHDFAKIYGLPQILQKYTSAVVAHGVRDLTSWPTEVGAARSGPVPLTSWATTLRP
jgi:hypothetical protein